MAQTYISDVPDGTTNILQDNINGRNNENTLRSSFSGTAFPDTPVAGQHCYRTDTEIEYIYDGTAWIEVAATNTLGLDVAAAKGTLNNLSSRLNISINPDGTLKDPTTANVDEFKVSNLTPTYVDATTFSVPDDLTGIFTAGRILKITDGAEIKYLSVVSSAFDTVTNVAIDGTITASISAVDYSLAQYGLPKASDAVKGVVKVGANINVDEGVISVPEATDTVKGVIELATPDEVLAGTDNERGITPATLTAKILGTVSQSSGIPTGAVIEHGVNTNGNYIKFADGTMICFDSALSATNLTVNVWKEYKYTLPAAFYSAPALSPDLSIGTSWAAAVDIQSGGSSATQVTILLITKSGDYPSLNNAVQYIAIGRWY